MLHHSNGTFVAVRFAEETTQALNGLSNIFNIPNPIAEYHSTVVYSRKPLKNISAIRDLDPVWIAKSIGFDIFDTNVTGIITKCLVLKINCLEIMERHIYFREVEGASHDFPTYIPHITLSYDIGDYDISKLQNIDFILPHLIIAQEYSEELKDEDRRSKERTEET